jgi:hypothetical protein
MSDKQDLRVVTPAFRVSFPNVFKPRASFKDQDPTYNIQMLFPENGEYPKDLKTSDGKPINLTKFGTDLKTLKRAMAAACKAKWGEKENWPKFKHKAIRNGTEEKSELDQYKGMLFINAKSKFKPGVIDYDQREILDESEFFAGAWARAILNVYTYDNSFGKGVQFGLQNIQLLAHDDSLAGKKNAKDDFDVIDGFDEDIEGEGFDDEEELDF